MRIDLVVPCFNEEDNVDEFVKVCSSVFDESEFSYRLIMVDDGSNDATFSHLTDLAHKNPCVEVIQFSRNFGKEAAMIAGLEASSGEYSAIIDADLQQRPEDALAMLRILVQSEGEYDCVAAYQEKRKESWLITKMKGMFYSIFAKAARSQAIPHASDFRVFTATVRDAIISLPESYRFSKGIFAWVGFRVKPYAYVPSDRLQGESKWSLSSLIRYAFEGILSFTTLPLRFVTYLGAVTSIGALLYAFITVLQILVFGKDVPGYASTLVVVLLLGGAQLLSIGILGEYLARVYMEGKQRPLYIVRSRVCSEVSDE